MPRQNVNDLLAFLAVARERSFTRAAAKLGVSQSALSHTIRGLEARLGLRLLSRTTRSVSPTEAGEPLLPTVGPRFDEVEAEVAALSELREKPDCINLRLSTYGGLYAWEFEKGGRELKVRVEGQLVFNGTFQMLNAALDGYGLAYVPEDVAQPHLAKGRLKRVLEDWCPPNSGHHLYYPSRRQSSPAFTLLVDALRYRS